MEIKINISKEVIDSNTDSTITTDRVLVNKLPLKYSGAPVYINFYNKIKALAKDKTNVELKHTWSKSGEYISWVTVLSNSATSEVFNIFRSMGMYMPKITIGVCESAHTLYTSTKLCRDISRYSESQQAAMLMYMLSLAHYVIQTEQNLISYTYDTMADITHVNASTKELVVEAFRTFAEEEVWYLKDSANDNYLTVRYENSTNVSVNEQMANPSCVRIGLLKEGSTNKHYCLASVQVGAMHYTYVVGTSKAFTDLDLCNIEIASDSVSTLVANAFGYPFSVTQNAKLPLKSDMELVEFDAEEFDEFAKSEKLNKMQAGWLGRMIAKGATVASADDFAYLVKAYGIKLPAGSDATTALSVDEMKDAYKDDSYAQELYKQVKPYYATYKLGDELDANVKGFSNGAIYAMAFVGASGTGKSTAARVLPARCGIPYISVNFSVNIEEADLFGSMIPNANKSSPEDPEFVWADGIITKAVRNGYCVILEELNFARPGVLGKLNSLLDENRQVDLSTGEIVRAHPNFRIIATCNIAYEGTNRFNKALINRFDDVTVFKDLPRTEAINVIKERTGYTNAVKISKVYDVYEALKKFAAEQNVNAVVSMRQLLNIFTKGKYYSTAKDAVKRIMINGAFIEDPEYQGVFEETVLVAFDLKFKI